MRTVAEQALFETISPHVRIRLIEPNIYTSFPDDAVANTYDTDFGHIYDTVACNPIYNRLVWGYSIKNYEPFTREALSSAVEGPLLDLACGSLAFTARTYLQPRQRVVIASDQSVQMLRIAKGRILKLHGEVPGNMVFVCADALRLPFRPNTFSTVISLNLIHCLTDIGSLLLSVKRLATGTANTYFTTLVVSNRLADRYLSALANAGKLVLRDIVQLGLAFEHAGMHMESKVQGNLAFLRAKESAGQAMKTTFGTGQLGMQGPG
jgi:SAM-dependent methyltransferase